MIKCNMLKFLFVWNFHSKMCIESSLISFSMAKWDCVIKTRKMFSSEPLINNLLAIGLNFYFKTYQQSYHEKQLIFMFFIWFVFFNVFINIIHIIWVFNKSFRILKMLSFCTFLFIHWKLIICFVWIFSM